MFCIRNFVFWFLFQQTLTMPGWGEQMGVKQNKYLNKELTYTFNAHGYRSIPFNDVPNKELKIIVLGCSQSFGLGIDDSNVWDKLINNTCNLSRPAGSADMNVFQLYHP